MNKILISGSEGFLGNFINLSQKKNNLTYAENPEKLLDKIKKNKFDLFIHFGAANRSNCSTEEIVRDNIINLYELLKFKSFKKIIFISTDAVTKLKKKTKNFDISSYALSKLLGEKLIFENCKKLNFEFVILRLNTVMSFGSKKKNLFYFLEKKNYFTLNKPNDIDYNLITKEQVYQAINDITKNWENYKNKIIKIESNEILNDKKLLKLLNNLKVKYRTKFNNIKTCQEKTIKLNNKNLFKKKFYEIKKYKKKN